MTDHTSEAATGTSNDPMAGGPRPTVIVGGGFAGLYTALALAEQRHHPPLLLIEPNEHFLFLPLLYELLSGELRRWEVAPRYDNLLAGKGIAWLQDRVTRIETEHSKLTTQGGHELSFEQLVLATGADVSSFGIPGVREHCLGFRSLEDVERLQQLVEQLRSEQQPLQRLAIVGAGASGVELACKLADMLEGAALIELIEQGPEALPQAKAFNREQGLRALQSRDVRLRTGTRVVAVGSSRLDLVSDGGIEQLPVRVVVWTAGLAFTPPAASPQLASDRRGRLRCEPSLRVIGTSQLFAAGDIAAVEHSDTTLPATAQVAFQQATCLAENLRRQRRGEPLESFDYTDLGEMVSLGRGEASLVGAGVTLAGAAAFQLRRLAYLSRLPGRSHQIKVAAGWLTDWGG